MYAAITVITLGFLAWDSYRRRDARLRWELTERTDAEQTLAAELVALRDSLAAITAGAGDKVAQRDEWFAARLKTQETALAEFLTQIRDVVRYSEEARRAAQGAKIGAALK